MDPLFIAISVLVAVNVFSMVLIAVHLHWILDALDQTPKLEPYPPQKAPVPLAEGQIRVHLPDSMKEWTRSQEE